jgi:hypothetical protein
MNAVLLLWILFALFLLRVAGQVPVMVGRPRWLPPPRQWYSGLVPYPWLLGFQLIFLALMVGMIFGLRGAGPLAHDLPWVYRACVAFSVPYFGFMIYRWVFRVLRNPARRWYDTLIPIALHCVLAVFLWTYGWEGLRRVGS